MGQQDCGTVPVNRPSGNLLFSTLRPVKYNFTLSILVVTMVTEKIYGKLLDCTHLL